MGPETPHPTSMFQFGPIFSITETPFFTPLVYIVSFILFARYSTLSLHLVVVIHFSYISPFCYAHPSLRVVFSITSVPRAPSVPPFLSHRPPPYDASWSNIPTHPNQWLIYKPRAFLSQHHRSYPAPPPSIPPKPPWTLTPA